jgi:predicted DNA-binding protein (MmcQ/YjbR family)
MPVLDPTRSDDPTRTRVYRDFMNIESARSFLLSLPHVVETRQWGDNLLFWVGDKAIGGKMCAVVGLGDEGAAMGGHISYPASPERVVELLEIEDISRAKYLARLSWVSIHRWDVFRTTQWQAELRAAHALTLAKLPPKAHRILALPKKEQKRMIAAQKAKVSAHRL